MAKKNRIFVSFAAEDAQYRDLLKGQANNEKSPFDFVDMSVKEPWDSQWKTNCRTKIKGCDGVIVLVSKNTVSASGALWEVACAKEENIPVRGVYIFASADKRPSSLPDEFKGVKIVDWTWENIKLFLDLLP